jgi:hypothetical protein
MAAAGATAATGGISAATLALGVAGVAGIAGGVAVATRGEDEPEPQVTPTPTPMPMPTPLPTPVPPLATPTPLPGPTCTLGFIGGEPPVGSSVRDPGANWVMDLALTITAQCSDAVAHARLFAHLRNATAACVVSYADLGLIAGTTHTVTVRGFVGKDVCRPPPYATDSLSVLLYDMDGSATEPISTASFAVHYDFVP